MPDDANGKLTAEQITALRVVFVNGVNVDERQLLPACIQWNETEYLNALATLCDMALASVSETAESDTAKDAARWRWWRRWWNDAGDDMEVINSVRGYGDDDDKFDAAVDEAMLRTGNAG